MKMAGCSAPKCANNSKKGYRLFRFPSQTERRKKWLQNCRRDKWEPNNSSRLCEIHFESSQYEENREDGWRKLKNNAIPTIFYVPNPPQRCKIELRKSKYKIREFPVIDSAQNKISVGELRIVNTPSLEEKNELQEDMRQQHSEQDGTSVEELIHVNKSLGEENKLLKEEIKRLNYSLEMCVNQLL